MQNILKYFCSSLYTISLYARQLAGTVVVIFLARYLSVYEYGLFSSYKTICIFILMFASLGAQEYILVSSNKNLHEIRIKITLFLLNAFFIIFLISALSIFLPVNNHYLFILILIRQFFDLTFFYLTLPYFQAGKKFNVISIFNLIYSFLIILTSLMCYYFKLSLIDFIILNIFVGFINFIQISKYIRLKLLCCIKLIKQILQHIDKQLLNYVYVYFLGYLYTQLPAMYMSLFVKKEVAALFFAAYSFSNIVFILINAQIQKIIPEMIGCSVEKLKKIIKQNLILFSCFNVLILLLIYFFGKKILLFVYQNSYYMQAFYPLILLTLANSFFSIMAIFGSYITASNNQHSKIKIQIETIFISVVSLLFLHKYNIYASVITYLITAAYMTARYVYKANKILKERSMA